MLCDILQKRINEDGEGGQREVEDEMKEDLKMRRRIETQRRKKRGHTEVTRGDDDDEEDEEEDEDASLSLPLPEL